MKVVATRAIFALIGLITPLLFAFGLASPAQAGGAPPYFYDECNSSASDNGIRSYNTNSPSIGNTLDIGQCRNTKAGPAMIFVPETRVDVNPELWYGTSNDINSYVPGEINVGYDTCRENSENADANPVDAWAPHGFRYKTYTDDNCNGNY